MGDKLEDKLVLVTGATGFVGSHLALTLADRGYRVRALVRNLAKSKHLKDAGIEIIHGDIVNTKAVNKSMEGVHTVYHIAALYRSARHADLTYRKTNIEGTRNVVKASQEFNIKRLVHCSTIGVHGDVQAIPADEDEPFNPGDIYQTSKLEGELLVQDAIKKGFPATVFRPAAVYGPGDMRFVKLFESIRLGRFRIFGSGNTLYHLIYIDDLVEGIILCGEKAAAIGRTYILAGPRYSTISELIDLVAEAVNAKPPLTRLPLAPLTVLAIICEGVSKPFGLEPPLYRRRLDFFCKNRAFNIGRAQRELSFNPVMDLQEGLKRTARWYFDKGFLDGKIHIRFRNSGYIE